MLQVDQVSKEFRGLRALNNVSFGIEAGKITGLIGPNGAGKTTLFNVISGVFQPTTGKVIFHNQNVTLLRPYERCSLGMARTFQIMKPLPYMSVIDNVIAGCMFGRYNCSGLASARAKTLEILEFTALMHRKDVLAKELGTADKKRLELARALGTNPSLLLLDEVMSGLNNTESDECVQLIRKINQNGITVLLIEHVMKVVVNLCEKIIVLHHGEKIAEGAADEVMNNELVIEVYLGKEEEHAQA
jgi:branched-chain amino acid transport system ATP-binding protein